MNKIQTAECVTAGHPDKICDQISDAILDACLKGDPASRVAVESMAGHGKVFLLGEVTTKSKVDFVKEARQVIEYFGYKNYDIESHIVSQSPEISERVDDGGAGDQGIMVGYACDETPEHLPLEFSLARKLTRAMGTFDGKSHVTIENGKIIRVVTSVGGPYSQELLGELHAMGIADNDPRWIRNQYETAGLDSDTGLTGRKIVVDAYGPRVPVGGGAFSGKDPSKVDRSAAYFARRIAVDLLKQKNAHEVTVKIAYSIGMTEALMTAALVVLKDGSIELIDNIEGYDFSPKAIAQMLKLYQPVYLRTAREGHFGNGFTWD